jgi:hypothetical protein
VLVKQASWLHLAALTYKRSKERSDYGLGFKDFFFLVLLQKVAFDGIFFFLLLVEGRNYFDFFFCMFVIIHSFFALTRLL